MHYIIHNIIRGYLIPLYRLSTGYSLSDQYILSPINPILSDIQRFTNCSEIQTCVLNFRTICVNLTKAFVAHWVNWWWQNMFIWQKPTCMYMTQTSNEIPDLFCEGCCWGCLSGLLSSGNGGLGLCLNWPSIKTGSKRIKIWILSPILIIYSFAWCLENGTAYTPTATNSQSLWHG